MTQAFASRLTLCPQVFDRAVADEVALAFADLSAPLRDLISASASCAPYLRDLSRSEAAWLRQELTLSPEDGFAAIAFDDDKVAQLHPFEGGEAAAAIVAATAAADRVVFFSGTAVLHDRVCSSAIRTAQSLLLISPRELHRSGSAR